MSKKFQKKRGTDIGTGKHRDIETESSQLADSVEIWLIVNITENCQKIFRYKPYLSYDCPTGEPSGLAYTDCQQAIVGQWGLKPAQG